MEILKLYSRIPSLGKGNPNPYNHFWKTVITLDVLSSKYFPLKDMQLEILPQIS